MTDPQITELLDRAAPLPSHLPDGAAVRARAPRARRSLIRLVGPVAALVVVVAVALVVAVIRREGRHHPAVRTGPRQVQTLRAEADDIARRLIDSSGLPPGARSVGSLPAGGFGPLPVDPNKPVVSRTGRWLVLGSYDDVRQYVLRHRPHDVAGGDSQETDGGRGPYRAFFLAGAQWQPTGARIPSPNYVVSVYGTGANTTAVEIDVRITLNPRRSEQTIPDTVTGAVVTISRTSFVSGVASRRLHRAVTQAQARRLAADLNALPPAPTVLFIHGCPPSPSRTTDTIDFGGPGPGRRVTIRLDECDGSRTVVRVGGHDTSPVLASGDLPSLLQKLVAEA